MKSDKEVLTRLDNLEMLKRPHLWPRWPVLPLKRYADGHLDCAVAVEDEGNMIQLYENVNIYMSKSAWGKPALLTAEEIIAKGYVVD